MASFTRILVSNKSATAMAMAVSSSSSAYYFDSQESSLGNSYFLTTQCEAPPSPKNPIMQGSNLKKRMTPIGHFSMISESQLHPSIVTFFMTLSGDKPFSAREFVDLWKTREMHTRHPRFHYTLHPDSHSHFKVPEDSDNIDVKSHISETFFPWSGRSDLIERIRLLQKERWSLKDSLWHVYIAPWGPAGTLTPLEEDEEEEVDNMKDEQKQTKKGESLLIFRGHHLLGDGASLGAAFLELFDEAQSIRQDILDALKRMKQSRKQKSQELAIWERWLRWCQKLFLFLAGSIKAFCHHTYLQFMAYIWESNPWKEIRELAEDQGVRTISWTDVASVDQIKWIGKELGGPSCTINDVMMACVSAALAKQIQFHRRRLEIVSEYKEGSNSTKRLIPTQRYLHIGLPVHLKGGVTLPGESLGNNIGAFVARVPGELPADQNSVARLKAINREMVDLKKSPTALLSHIGARMISYASYILPLSWSSCLYSSANAGSIAVVSNNRITPKPLHIAGRKVESFYGFVPLPPGVPIGIVLTSYAGKMHCSLTAQQWAVPNGDQFLAWMLEEYLNLLAEAKARKST